MSRHEQAPRDPDTNLDYRRELLALAAEDEAFQAQCIQDCKADILFFINAFVLQYNPQLRDDEVGPFVTWPFQERALLGGVNENGDFEEGIVSSVTDGKDLVIQKSREMGASWLCLIVMLWFFLFHPYKKFLLISRSADAVDCDDPDSLFWKLDFILRHLPPWLIDSSKIKRRGMFLGNLDTHSTITGQASTGRAGVGGRATAIFVDEFAQIREAHEVLHRTADTSKCRIFNSTHTGPDTAFAEICGWTHIRKVRMHWSQHPEKNRGLYQYLADAQRLEVFDKQFVFHEDFVFCEDGKLRSPWYDAECRRRGYNRRAIATDLDIDPLGSASQFFDAQVITDLHRKYAVDPYWEGDLKYDKDLGRPEGLVKRKGGPIRLWVMPDGKGHLHQARYCAGADISNGVGSTPSCLSIIDADQPKKICEVSERAMPPETFAVFCVALLRLFNSPHGTARFVWESAGPGIKFGDRVIELGYTNFHMKRDEFDLSKHVTTRPGWYPGPKDQLLLLENYREGLSSGKLLVESSLSLKEALVYHYGKNNRVTPGKPKKDKDDPANTGWNHGDMVVADALAWMLARLHLRGPAKELPVELPVMSFGWRRLYRANRRRSQGFWS